jgi:glycine/D-amino acid oxidase-like deaminating enzyme
MKVAVIGGGIAGTLLTWRLAQERSIAKVELYLGPADQVDATAVSGGVVRAYEPGARQRRLAADSLAELLSDERLRKWACYRQLSSVYTVPDMAGLDSAASELEARIPDSAQCLSAAELRAYGWTGLAERSGALYERRAGCVDPNALRNALLRRLANDPQVSVHPGAAPSQLGCDVTVVAAGAWTPEIVAARRALAVGGTFSGRRCTNQRCVNRCRVGRCRARARGVAMRTKAIQYAVYQAGWWRPPPFVDTTTGLYGRPVDGGILLGLPTQRWDVPPGRLRTDPVLAARAAELATSRFPRLKLGAVLSTVSVADCYLESSCLALRPVDDPSLSIFTFTGGSGGAAKSALAASRLASTALVSSASTTSFAPAQFTLSERNQ